MKTVHTALPWCLVIGLRPRGRDAQWGFKGSQPRPTNHGLGTPRSLLIGLNDFAANEVNDGVRHDAKDALWLAEEL